MLYDTYGIARLFNPNMEFAFFLGQVTNGKEVTLVRTADVMFNAAELHGLDEAAQGNLYLGWITSLEENPTLPLMDYIIHTFTPQPEPAAAPAAAPGLVPLAPVTAAPAAATPAVAPYQFQLSIDATKLSQWNAVLANPVQLTQDGVYDRFLLPFTPQLGFVLEVVRSNGQAYVAAALKDTTAEPFKVLNECEARTSLGGDYDVASQLVFNGHPLRVSIVAG